jgi:SAM-dependent methyltransferase
MHTKIYEEMSSMFPLWRETTLGKNDHEKREVNFVTEVFGKYHGEIKKVIDLGSGVGLHADLLAQKGYELTAFDKSEKALEIAKEKNPQVQTVQGDFETIDITEEYDAAICMWSTLSYIYSNKSREKFYTWQRDHARKIIILDEANFYRYPASFHKVYEGENNEQKLKVVRDWQLHGTVKDTQFIYEITDKATGKTETVNDAEREEYVPVEQIQKYLGNEWKLQYLLGDYDLGAAFDKENSSRIIAVFFR